MNFLKKLSIILFGTSEDNKREQITNVSLTDNFYHESGHILLNKLFDETLTMEQVTLDYSSAVVIDRLSFGGVKGKYAIPVTELTVNDHDKAILAMLAGLCVDEIAIKNRVIDSELYTKKYWAAKLGEPKYAGDLELIGKNFHHIKTKIALDWEEYITSALRSLVDILNQDTVWQSVLAVRDALRNSPTKTLTSNDVDDVLATTGFIEWKKKNKKAIVDERACLLTTRSNLTVLWQYGGRRIYSQRLVCYSTSVSADK